MDKGAYYVEVGSASVLGLVDDKVAREKLDFKE